MNATDSRPLRLAVRSVAKDYAVRVLHAVDLDIDSAEIHGLVGANGAGKSTLCSIIAGLLTPSSGTMLLDGHTYQPQNKLAAEQLGVQIVQQELTLVRNLTVAESLFLNRLPTRLGIILAGELHRRTRLALDRFELFDIQPEDRIERLGVGQLQLLEIVNALDRQCRLLILDEPTAMLTARESTRLFSKLRELRGQDISVLYISHRLQEVKELTDRVTVLRDGCRIGTFRTVDMSTQDMVQAMSVPTLPKSISTASLVVNTQDSPVQEDVQSSKELQQQAAACNHRSKVAMRVDRLCAEGKVSDVTFQVSEGEILGISGLIGSGRTELLRAIFGAHPASSGSVWLTSRGQTDAQDVQTQYRFRHPSQAVARGLAMLTEDRKQNGLMLPQSIAVNMTLASLQYLRLWPGRLNRQLETQMAHRMIEQLDIRCQHVGQSVSTLSGGNQQKVVLAKWLLRGAKVFLLDEPTRGIDMASRHLIYQVLAQLSARGAAIVIVSSDLEELLTVCDRIGVMSNGHWVAEFTKQQFDSEAITRAAFVGYHRDQLASEAENG